MSKHTSARLMSPPSWRPWIDSVRYAVLASEWLGHPAHSDASADVKSEDLTPAHSDASADVKSEDLTPAQCSIEPKTSTRMLPGKM
ncbi:MAG: hypothetical protein PHU43_07340 [Candidatus Bipolaricaulis sp.]|nr:hypothetical protein [Candidatus Bipolaricaulis sp.]